uniref:Uncharacterized protein n=1 Tax=Solanum lycopersicum TaxID=4081 RepID=A0A3Q7FMQ6_SOLLC
MASSNSKIIFIFFILISIFTPQTFSQSDYSSCESQIHNTCNNKSKALTLKIIAIVSILVTSMIGVCLPLVTRSISALSPDRNVFVIVKAFAAGIILGTGFMHVLPDSFEMLLSNCLKENPWHKFPFTGFVAMLSAIVTLAIDSMATSLYSKKHNNARVQVQNVINGTADQELGNMVNNNVHFHSHHHGSLKDGTKLLRYRVIAMVLELGIIVHSIVIGISLGSSNNTCTIKGLVAALCFHQMFEGMGLGGCILQAEYKMLKKTAMAFFFSVTTPFGIALGIALSNTYQENSPRALITVGLLNASSAGLLIYMALVDLLAADFMGDKLQGSIKLQIKAFIAYIAIFLLLISILAPRVLSVVEDCGAEEDNSCVNKSKALPLKIIAIVSILITSMIGVCLPLVTRSIPALSPERNLFVIVKAFAAGIILATGFMHVLPDSFDMLSSSCLKEHPWHKFPFTGFVAMLSAIVTMAIDSIATSLYSKKHNGGVVNPEGDQEMAVAGNHVHSHHHHGSLSTKDGLDGKKLLRYRVIAMVLELGIIVHSIVIGLSLGASSNTCTIKGLVAALCFHQMFEGMGLGGCILQASSYSAEYKFMKKAIMAFFFAVTTPFGIALGIALSTTYEENSPRALITVGLLNASSAGLLIYMALVDLLAADFMGDKLQGSVKLQIKSYMAVLLGAGGMSVMAIWA